MKFVVALLTLSSLRCLLESILLQGKPRSVFCTLEHCLKEARGGGRGKDGGRREGWREEGRTKDERMIDLEEPNSRCRNHSLK